MPEKGPISSVCHPVDTSKTVQYFSRFPAAINIANDLVESTLRSIGDLATEPGSRLRRRVRIRHECPFGDPFAICHASAFPDRLLILGSIIELMWVHDDITEELDHQDAIKKHESLSNLLRIDIDPSTFEAESKLQILLAEAVRKGIDTDPDAAPVMIKTMFDYIMTFDSNNVDFDNMATYMPYRISNCGYWMSSYFIRWGMGNFLTDEDYKSIKEYDIAMGNILGLTNDYFSWNVEKDQETDRLRNAVKVLMKQHGITAEVAKQLLLGIIVDEESRATKLREERLKQPASEELLRYIEAIELYIGGSCYWHGNAPRYQKYQ